MRDIQKTAAKETSNIREVLQFIPPHLGANPLLDLDLDQLPFIASIAQPCHKNKMEVLISAHRQVPRVEIKSLSEIYLRLVYL